MIASFRSLGPEPFSDAFSTTYLVEQLQQSKRPIKVALLDQRLVAGVGNIYADVTVAEGLYRGTGHTTMLLNCA
ncbi:DNA-formamidopyrimidine glycosylase [cyanobiont of Ornithocercus magnificus]|nr:DNA-formamidopyrimidine glycosylase [cyanobiont of Ornithocercus magnificus]